MDSMGREVNTEDEYDTNEVDAAYLKLINVPCLYDMGAAPSDPADAQLCLNILDDQTFYKVVQSDFLFDKRKREKKKIDKFKQALQACHLNIYVSEVVITVLGTVNEDLKTKRRDFTAPPTLYEGIKLPLVIDGEHVKNIPIKRIVINRLLKSDGEQASVPIQTFLPFTKDDQPNQKAQKEDQ